MERKLSDLILLSDIDGTLMNAPAPIPPQNITALERFINEGGRFGLATGRAIESARAYQRQLPVNAPCILFNGGGIYDYQKEKLLFVQQLPDSYKAYIRIVTNKFPEIGVALFPPIPNTISVAKFMYTEKYLGVEHIPFLHYALDDVTQPCMKCIFVAPDEWINEVISFIDAQEWPDVTFVQSSENFYEMLPLGVTKGTGLEKLAELTGKPLAHFVAIGDFYNDEKMLQTAGYAATVADAPEDIQKICDVVVCDCMHGALAQLVEHLERVFK